jgi:hypothetical protein
MKTYAALASAAMRAVDGEKGVGGGEGRPLVAVDEGMVLREAFPQGGGLLDEVGVVAGLRAVESGFRRPRSRPPATRRSALSGRHGWRALRRG